MVGKDLVEILGNSGLHEPALKHCLFVPNATSVEWAISVGVLEGDGSCVGLFDQISGNGDISGGSHGGRWQKLAYR